MWHYCEAGSSFFFLLIMTLPLDSDTQPAKEQDKFVLRLPVGMRDVLKAAAKENNRSLNAELVARLDQSLANEPARLREEDFEHIASLIANKLRPLLPLKDR